MKVLVLTAYPEQLSGWADDDVTLEINTEPNAAELEWADFVVSFGYRKIIPPLVVAAFRERMINIHTSLLPWNKGAYCNFWSWYERTPKGVTIHYIDDGIDTGPILARHEVTFHDPTEHTLKTSYDVLHEEAILLFARTWKSIRDGVLVSLPHPGGGSFHKKIDLKPIWPLLSNGWDTPVSEVIRLGDLARERANAHMV